MAALRSFHKRPLYDVAERVFPLHLLLDEPIELPDVVLRLRAVLCIPGDELALLFLTVDARKFRAGCSPALRSMRWDLAPVIPCAQLFQRGCNRFDCAQQARPTADRVQAC
jgi:hypothetical protein